MPEGLSWVFELFDKFSGPADRMRQSVDQFSSAIDKSKGGFGSFVGVLHDSIHIIQMVGEGLMRIGEKGFELAKFALHAAEFKENTMLALETILQSKTEAEEVVRKGVELAANTPFKTSNILDIIKNFIVAGVGKNDAMTLTKAVSDLGAMKGMDTGKMDLFASWMTRIQSLGHLDLRSVTMMGREQILPMNKMMESLAKVTGMSMDQVRGALKAGTIDSQTGIKGLLETLRGLLHENTMGEFSKRAGRETLSGVFSTLESRFEEVFADLDKSKAFDSLKKFVISIADYLSPESESGKAIVQGIGEMADAIAEGMGAFAAGFKEVVPSVKDFFALMTGGLGGVNGFKDSMHSLGAALGDVAIVLADIVHLLALAFKGWDLILHSGDKDRGFFGTAKDFASYVGGGFTTGVSGFLEMGKDMGGKVVGGFQSALGIHSPSKVFEELGEYSVEGYQLGLNGKGASAAALMPGSASGAQGGAGMKMSFVINAHSAESKAVAERVKDVVMSALTSSFEEVAIEAGVC